MSELPTCDKCGKVWIHQHKHWRTNTFVCDNCIVDAEIEDKEIERKEAALKVWKVAYRAGWSCGIGEASAEDWSEKDFEIYWQSKHGGKIA